MILLKNNLKLIKHLGRNYYLYDKVKNISSERLSHR